MTDQNKSNGPSAQDAAERAKHEVRSMGEDVKNRAANAAGAAKAEALRRTEGAKGSFADELDRIAAALQAACGELRGGSTAERGFEWAAHGVERTARTVRSRETSELVNEIGSFARRNPSLFLGGAALLGFAASRFAKASGRRREHDHDAATPAAPMGDSFAERPVTPSSPAASTTPGGVYQS